MSSILGIQSFVGANDAIHRHFPWFEKAGCDEIVGIGTDDGKCWFPAGIRQEQIGANSYINGSHLPVRLLRSFEMLLKTKHDWLVVAEYDVLFFKPLPTDLPKGITAHLAGGKPFNCHCNLFAHGPWIADRETAWNILAVGAKIIESGVVDPSPDCFLGQIIEQGKIPFHSDILKSYSRNTINQWAWIQEARQAIADGAVSIHGIKQKEVLDAIVKEND